jgi:hypothetical protein
MSSIYEQEIEDGVFEDVGSPCVALVPATPTVCRAAKFALTRPNANFVTELIATAEHLPQTRELCRAAPTEAVSAYSVHLHRVDDAGLHTQQTI